MNNIDKFLSKVNKTESCWIWIGFTNKDGYGKTYNNYKTIQSHRFSYELFKGLIPKNMLVLHKCDNPPCVNPEHLFLGTRKDNMLDMSIKNRGKGGLHNKIKTHCKRGHELSGNNLYIDTVGFRQCKTCRSIRDKKRRKNG